jgi:hypothetical protein
MRPISGQWAYVLSDIGRPEPPPVLGPDVSPENDEAREGYYARYTSWKDNACLRSIGVSLHPVVINSYSMFAFKVRSGEADDGFAQRFADGVLGTLALVSDFALEEPLLPLRVPASLLRSRKLTTKKLLFRQAVPNGREPLDEMSLWMKFNHATYLPTDVLTRVWELAPVTTRSPFFEALHFYGESLRAFCFLGDDIAEVLSDRLAGPLSRQDQVRAERAVENAFKAIEAMIGEPPKRQDRLRRKLEEAGVSPDELIGWQWFGQGPPPEPLFTKVKALHQARDKRAAHAKTPQRSPFTYYEIMDSQGCAQVVLVRALEHQLGKQSGR